MFKYRQYRQNIIHTICKKVTNHENCTVQSDKMREGLDLKCDFSSNFCILKVVLQKRKTKNLV